MKLTNNTILITGGTRGIGLELTKQFSELGNKIIVVGKNQKKIDFTKNSITDLTYYNFNLENQNELEELIVCLENKHPAINVLINNAAVQYNYDILKETSLFSKVDSEININFKTPIKLIGSLLPTLMNNPESAIVNITSALAFAPKESAPVYSATKSALHSFSTSLRYQLEHTNIKVFELIPPLVNTDMTKGRGANKMEPNKLVKKFIIAFKNDKYEISIGKVKLLRIIQRLSPKIALKVLRKS